MYLYMYLHLQYIHLQENSIVSRQGKIFTTNGLMITAINCGATSVNDVCIGFLTPPFFLNSFLNASNPLIGWNFAI